MTLQRYDNSLKPIATNRKKTHGRAVSLCKIGNMHLLEKLEFTYLHVLRPAILRL